MAKQYEFTFAGQPTLYGSKSREVTMYFSEPEAGINESTGILQLISGYGGRATSNVYKKMREKFADAYNLVVLQCDYLGQQFMQEDYPLQVHTNEYKHILTPDQFEDFVQLIEDRKLLEASSKYKCTFHPVLGETLDNYNDQGPIQAMDNLVALKILIDIIQSNNLTFNTRKIMLMGHSHGAYLALLCNSYAPDVYSFILDNSAYTYPEYMNDNYYRDVYYISGDISIKIAFEYLSSKLEYDKELYDLIVRYQQFSNQATIVSFHGENDEFMKVEEKAKFLNGIEHTILECIDKSKVDNVVFKSTDHGLDADFLKHFAYVCDKYSSLMEKATPAVFRDVEITTAKHRYCITMNEYGTPVFYVKE